MRNAERLFHCPHATILRHASGHYPVQLKVSRGNISGGFSVASVRVLREKIAEDREHDSLCCPCLHTWAETDMCWSGCGGDPVEAVEGYPFCEKCAQAMRETAPAPANDGDSCLECGEPVEDPGTLCGHCAEVGALLANINNSIDLISEARAIGIEPASVLKAVRDYTKRAVSR